MKIHWDEYCPSQKDLPVILLAFKICQDFLFHLFAIGTLLHTMLYFIFYLAFLEYEFWSIKYVFVINIALEFIILQVSAMHSTYFGIFIFSLHAWNVISVRSLSFLFLVVFAPILLLNSLSLTVTHNSYTLCLRFSQVRYWF